MIDADDINGYGPEHYYTRCWDLAFGTYQIKVNFYAGSSSSSTSDTVMRIRAGKTSWLKRWTIGPQRG